MGDWSATGAGGAGYSADVSRKIAFQAVWSATGAGGAGHFNRRLPPKRLLGDLERETGIEPSNTTASIEFIYRLA
jgi:hypothetical protein